VTVGGVFGVPLEELVPKDVGIPLFVSLAIAYLELPSSVRPRHP
jgi:hypothetical protein